MGKIVRLVPRERGSVTPPAGGGRAEILLFTGVRHEYLDERSSRQERALRNTTEKPAAGDRAMSETVVKEPGTLAHVSFPPGSPPPCPSVEASAMPASTNASASKARPETGSPNTSTPSR